MPFNTFSTFFFFFSEGDAHDQLREVEKQITEISPSITDVENRKSQMHEEARRVKNEINGIF